MLLKRLLNSTKLIQVDPCSFSLLMVIIEVDSYYIKKGIYMLDMIFQIQKLTLLESNHLTNVQWWTNRSFNCHVVGLVSQIFKNVNHLLIYSPNLQGPMGLRYEERLR